jgi:hypothetical protein
MYRTIVCYQDRPYSFLAQGEALTSVWLRGPIETTSSEVTATLSSLAPWPPTQTELFVPESLFSVDDAEAYFRKAFVEVARQGNALRWPHGDGVTELRAEAIEHHTRPTNPRRTRVGLSSSASQGEQARPNQRQSESRGVVSLLVAPSP